MYSYLQISTLGITVYWYFDAKRISECGNAIERAGQIGDSFGPLTSLFTSLALGAAILGTWYQVREFRSQLDEMRLSRDEMEEQTRTYKHQLQELQEQTRILKEQNFQSQRQTALKELPFFCFRIYEKRDMPPEPDHLAFDVENSGARIFNFRYEGIGFQPSQNVAIIEGPHGTNMGMKSNGTQRCSFPIEIAGTIGEVCQRGCSVRISYVLESGIEMEEIVHFPKPDGDFVVSWFAIAVSNRVDQAAFLEKRLRC
jgi:hypothetical protein